MRHKGTKPSSVCRQEEGPPPSPDGAHSNGDPDACAGRLEPGAYAGTLCS
uniref:Uncharacterized protein n=1 Tax=Peromyscus maniculatus bairdii TaxID=230844 RepID=A0A8C8UPR3_PERMB